MLAALVATACSGGKGGTETATTATNTSGGTSTTEIATLSSTSVGSFSTVADSSGSGGGGVCPAVPPGGMVDGVVEGMNYEWPYAVYAWASGDCDHYGFLLFFEDEMGADLAAATGDWSAADGYVLAVLSGDDWAQLGWTGSGIASVEVWRGGSALSGKGEVTILGEFPFLTGDEPGPWPSVNGMLVANFGDVQISGSFTAPLCAPLRGSC